MWKYAYQVPENKKIRVIVHTDCKNEADDQFALAHLSLIHIQMCIRDRLHSVSTGAAGSRQLDLFGPKILEGDYRPGFFMKHFIKDMKPVSYTHLMRWTMCQGSPDGQETV